MAGPFATSATDDDCSVGLAVLLVGERDSSAFRSPYHIKVNAAPTAKAARTTKLTASMAARLSHKADPIATNTRSARDACQQPPRRSCRDTSKSLDERSFELTVASEEDAARRQGRAAAVGWGGGDAGVARLLDRQQDARRRGGP